jgi:hypothetical protein
MLEFVITGADLTFILTLQNFLAQQTLAVLEIVIHLLQCTGECLYNPGRFGADLTLILILQNFLAQQTVAVLEIVIHLLENVHVILEDLEKIVQ